MAVSGLSIFILANSTLQLDIFHSPHGFLSIEPTVAKKLTDGAIRPQCTFGQGGQVVLVWKFSLPLSTILYPFV